MECPASQLPRELVAFLRVRRFPKRPRAPLIQIWSPEKPSAAFISAHRSFSFADKSTQDTSPADCIPPLAPAPNPAGKEANDTDKASAKSTSSASAAQAKLLLP